MLKKILILMMLCMIISSYIFASTTGKIVGKITDAETGEALPSVNIIIVGTQQGTASDADGYFVILNVRPGEYTLRASMIGYASQTKTNVVVEIDRTVTIDFQMSKTVIMGDEVTIVASRPIVEKDVSSSQTIIKPIMIKNNTYKTFTDVLSAQPGVLGFGALASRPMLRGSTFHDADFRVDGNELGDDISNTPYMKVNLSSIQEIQVVTGGFNAEYGNVRSGIINIITKEGTNHYTGSIDLKYSPAGLKHFGPMAYGSQSPIVLPMISEKYGAFSGVQADGTPNYMFAGWDKYSNSGEYLKEGDPHYGKPYENLALYLWRHRSKSNLKLLKQLFDEGKVQGDISKIDLDEDAVFEYGLEPDWVGEFTFGGPIPFTNNKVNFFMTHRQEQTAYALTTPIGKYNDRLTTLKLSSDITPTMKLVLSGIAAWQQGTNGGQGPGIGSSITNNPYMDRAGSFFDDVQRGTTSANKLWYPHCNTPGEQKRYSVALHFTHTLNSKTYYEISLNSMLTEESLIRRNRNTIKIAGSKWGATHLQYGRLGTETDIANHIANGDYDWENWKNYAKIKIGDYWYDEAPWGYGPTNWRDVTGDYRMESCNLQANSSVYRYNTLNASITSQVNRFNLVKAGVMLKLNNIHMDWVRIDPSVNNGRIYKGGKDGYIRPWTGAIYIQDKLEFAGMIANIGLRWDWQLRDYGIIQDGPDDDPVTGPYNPNLQAGAIDNLDKLNWKKKFWSLFSPRIGISHPMSENSKIFFNYGHFYKWPSEYDLYYMRFKTVDGGRMERMGNPDLKPPRTIMYEVGYAHNILDAVRLTATGYYKDITNESFEARYYPLEGKDVRHEVNGVYRDIRGVELRADLRYTRFLNGYVSYDYMISSRGAYGYDRFYQDPTKENRRVSSNITQPDVRPVFKANLDFHTPSDWGFQIFNYHLLANVSVGVIYNWRQGESFTWNPEAIPYVENNIRWRPYQRTDLRFRKTLFNQGNIGMEIYVDVTNLFNNKNMTGVRGYRYNTENFTKVLTGASSSMAWEEHKWWSNEFIDYMNSLDIDTGDRPGDYKSKDKPYIKMPGFTPWTFLEKRMVFFGIRINFN